MSDKNDAVNASAPWTEITYHDDGPGAHAHLIIVMPTIEGALWPRFQVPGKLEPEPENWWIVAAWTGFSAARVADAWEKNGRGNKLIDELVRALAVALSGISIPLDAVGTPDIDRLRGIVVRRRLDRNRLDTPHLFAWRPDIDVLRARSLLRDVWSTHLFRIGTGGDVLGIPGLVMSNEQRLMLTMLDDEVAMRGILTRSIRYSSGPMPTAKHPPRELVLDLIRWPDPKLPVLEGIVRIPTLRPDGTVLDRPGYDPASKTWYAPDFELEPIPEAPTPEDVAKAKEIIEEPFAQFPFVASADRTGFLACLIEPIVKPMIHGPRPLYVLDAPPGGCGTGKTLGAKTARAIITGEGDSTITSLGRREEETEKRITSILRSGNVFVVLDNLTGVVRSESLMQLATSERWQARLLGVSESPSLPNTATWLLTLNGAQLVRDLTRRSVLVRLDAKVDKPWERTGFKIENLVGWALQHRAEVIRALLILARAWVVAGEPKDPSLVRGSYEAWARVVGGVLYHAGYTGLMDALRAADDRDVDVEDHRSLVLAWMLEYPGQAMTMLAIGELAKKHGLYAGRVSRFSGGISLAKKISPIIQSIIGKPIAGYMIVEGATIGHCRTYQLVLAPPAQSSC